MRRCERRQGNKPGSIHALAFDGPLARAFRRGANHAGVGGIDAVQVHRFAGRIRRQHPDDEFAGERRLLYRELQILNDQIR